MLPASGPQPQAERAALRRHQDVHQGGVKAGIKAGGWSAKRSQAEVQLKAEENRTSGRGGRRLEPVSSNGELVQRKSGWEQTAGMAWRLKEKRVWKKRGGGKRRWGKAEWR